jgi:type VI protein secretion system component VasF
MDALRLFIALLYALPEVIKFIKQAQARESEEKLEKKVRQDLEKINRAFEKKDSSELNDVFKS